MPILTALAPIYNATTTFTNNGQMASGCLLYTYQAGSFTVLQNSYTTQNAAVPNSNPIVLNSSGRIRSEIWLDISLSYNFVLTLPDGFTVIQSLDNINGISIVPVNFNATPYADETGTPDAITASFTVSNPVLYDGYYLTLGITTPNLTTTPTFTPTLNGIVQAPHFMSKFVNNVEVPLAIGDLMGDVDLRFDLPNLLWVLMNPASSMGAVGGSGGTGFPANPAFYENDLTIINNYKITTGKNAMTAGPVTINAGITVTVPVGSNWSIV
jgi:hypothetical protein